MHFIRPVLWSPHHVQGLGLHQLHQPYHHILFQGLKWCTRLHPSFLLGTTMAIMPTKLVSATFLLRISFVIIMGNRDIRQFWLPMQNLPTSSVAHQPKAKAPQPSIQVSSPRAILIRMLRRRNTMLTRGRCFKPMPLKFKLYKMNSNHWKPNLLI